MPGRPVDLESFRQMLDDGKVWVAVGKIVQLDLAEDRSVWRAKLNLFPNGDESVVRMAWGQVGPNAGVYGPATEGDLVVVVYADADPDHGFVIARISSREDLIPEQAGEGHTFIKALAGRKAYIGSDTGVLIGKNVAGSDPDEPLVLGNVLKALLSSWLDADMAQTHMGNLGAPTGPPINVATYAALKASPIEDDAMNSDIAFTEKGD